MRRKKSAISATNSGWLTLPSRQSTRGPYCFATESAVWSSL